MAKKTDDTPSWIILCDEIDDGEYDEGLQEIARTIQTRLDVRDARRARRMISSLTRGTRVMLTNGVKPRYLEGMVGKIKTIDVENQAAEVILDELPTPGRGRPTSDGPSKRIIIPFIHLMIVNEDTVVPSQLNDEEVGDDEEDDDDDYEDDEDDDD